MHRINIKIKNKTLPPEIFDALNVAPVHSMNCHKKIAVFKPLRSLYNTTIKYIENQMSRFQCCHNQCIEYLRHFWQH